MRILLLIILYFLLLIGCSKNENTESNPNPLSSSQMLAPLVGQTSAVYQNNIYTFGGRSKLSYVVETENDKFISESKRVFKYNPATNEWLQMTSMPTALTYLRAHTINNKIYIFGGYGDGEFDNSVLEYDPKNDSWQGKKPMPIFRSEFASIEVAGKVYLIGGLGTVNNGLWEHKYPSEYKNGVEIYDASTDSWSEGSSAPSILAFAATCAHNENIYVLGGSSGNYLSSNYTYNTTTDTWKTNSYSTIERYRHQCVSVGPEFYVIGGRNSTGRLDGVEKYIVDNDAWSNIFDIDIEREVFSANVVAGKIYIIGGQGGESLRALDTMEIIDVTLLDK